MSEQASPRTITRHTETPKTGTTRFLFFRERGSMVVISREGPAWGFIARGGFIDPSKAGCLGTGRAGGGCGGCSSRCISVLARPVPSSLYQM